jgi:hypothetical protein
MVGRLPAARVSACRGGAPGARTASPNRRCASATRESRRRRVAPRNGRGHGSGAPQATQPPLRGPRQGARPRGAAAAQRPNSAQLPRPPFTTNEYPGRGSPRLGAVAAAAAGRPHRPHFHRSCVRVGRRRSLSARARGRDGSALWPACGGGAEALPVALAGAAGGRLGQPRRSRQPAPPNRAPGPQHHQHQQQREHRS